MNKKRLCTLLLLLLGIGLLIYPFIASEYNARHQSIVTSNYAYTMSKTDPSDLAEKWAEAKSYNDLLRNRRVNPKEAGYDDLLSTPDGTMGVIRIPVIDVDMPIYHGISNQAMTTGAGHMPNTSLPIGGEDTHCVISSHSGLASYRGFTDLPDMQIGDLFYVDVLGETLTYEVIRVQTVLPHEIETVQAEPGQDLFSLVTCVPICVNTHRLVVTGSRVQDAPAAVTSPTEPTAEAIDADKGRDQARPEADHAGSYAWITAGIATAAVPAAVILRKRK